MTRTIIVVLAVAAVFLAGRDMQAEDIGVRISLDHNSHQIITEMPVLGRDFTEKNLYYPRVKRLSDGSLLLCFMNDHFGWDLYASRSTDGGVTWSDAVLLMEKYPAVSTVGDDMMVYVNPDFIELQDGRIMLAYQWRYKNGYNDIPNTNKNCGIGIIFSSDQGRTWYGARSVYRGRCWEPALLQLPSGEIQMYITSSQNVVNGLSCPRTVIIRSFDGGFTWQGKEECDINDNEIISYTKDGRFGYDGMPTAVILDDGTIAMSVEVWSGKYVVDQTPVIVRTSPSENWRLDTAAILRNGGPAYPQKKQANKDLIGYGPYIGKLPSGETLLLSNGLYRGEQSSWLLTGDRNADNFGFATTGFNGYWGSVDYAGNGKVIITGTEKYRDGEKTRGRIHIMTGRVNKAMDISQEDPVLVPPDRFDRETENLWFLGRTTTACAYYDFSYTDDAFVFSTWLFTDKLTSFSVENSDASVIMFCRNGQVYKAAVAPSGDYEVSVQENNSWHVIASGRSHALEVCGSVNDDTDTDIGFAAKVHIPWKLIGGEPAGPETIKIHPAMWNKAKSTEKYPRHWEELQGENPDIPDEWLWITINRTCQERAEMLVSQMTLEEKVCLISGQKDGFHTASIERLGIPSIRFADGPQGVRNKTKSTFYPCGMSLASTWNPELAVEMGKGLALDARARGIGVMLGPGVNIYRSALSGRNFEYYGEDPCLSSAIACGYIKGMQDNGVIATVKHFAANNQEYLRHATNSVVDERTLHELYFPVFKDAVEKAGVGAVMTSYNPLNGMHSAENRWLIEDVLRGRWGFDGIVMSDWTSTYTTLGCVESGLDLEMPEGYWLNYEMVRELLDNGIIKESQIDSKCVNILKTFIRFGLLDRNQEVETFPENNPECKRIAYKVALEGPVLLKNDNILPLSRKMMKNMAVTGPNADIIPFGGGSGEVTPMDGEGVTLLEGISAAAGDKNVVHVAVDENMDFDEEAIRKAPVVIVSVGYTKQTEREGYDRTFHLPDGQDSLISKIAGLNSNVIVIVNSGGEVAMPWLDEVKAVILDWYPGQEGGRVLADLISGKVSPCGRLPFTFWGSEEANPSYPYYAKRENKIVPEKRDRFFHTVYYEGVFSGYRGMTHFGRTPLFPFGYGLTYSDFEYSDLEVVYAGDGCDVIFTVRNIGKYTASDVPQVYVTECRPEVPRPDRELKGFSKVKLAPGEETTVKVHLGHDAFSHYDIESRDFVVTPGKFRITVAENAAAPVLSEEINVL